MSDDCGVLLQAVAAMSELLTDLRGIGLPMGGRYRPTSFTDPETEEDHTSQLHMGYTTDPAKAEQAREMGATVTRCPSTTPGFEGWEVSVRVVDGG